MLMKEFITPFIGILITNILANVSLYAVLWEILSKPKYFLLSHLSRIFM